MRRLCYTCVVPLLAPGSSVSTGIEKIGDQSALDNDSIATEKLKSLHRGGVEGRNCRNRSVSETNTTYATRTRVVICRGLIDDEAVWPKKHAGNASVSSTNITFVRTTSSALGWRLRHRLGQVVGSHQKDRPWWCRGKCVGVVTGQGGLLLYQGNTRLEPGIPGELGSAFYVVPKLAIHEFQALINPQHMRSVVLFCLRRVTSPSPSRVEPFWRLQPPPPLHRYPNHLVAFFCLG